MKIFIDQKEIYDEVEISIKCRVIDESLEKLISELRLYNYGGCPEIKAVMYSYRLLLIHSFI